MRFFRTETPETSPGYRSPSSPRDLCRAELGKRENPDQIPCLLPPSHGLSTMGNLDGDNSCCRDSVDPDRKTATRERGRASLAPARGGAAKRNWHFRGPRSALCGEICLLEGKNASLAFAAFDTRFRELRRPLFGERCLPAGSKARLPLRGRGARRGRLKRFAVSGPSLRSSRRELPSRRRRRALRAPGP